MAFLLPENLPSRSDVPQAVRDMAAVLRDHLGDDSTVWLDHEDDQPFLIVFKPQCGIVLIHVVEGGARGLEAKARKILKSNKKITYSQGFLMYPMHKEEVITLVQEKFEQSSNI